MYESYLELLTTLGFILNDMKIRNENRLNKYGGKYLTFKMNNEFE